MRPRKKEIKLESMEDFWPPKWFFAYSDLATLMMTFFLILATMVVLKIPLHLISEETEKIPLTAAEFKKIITLSKLDDNLLSVLKKMKGLEGEQIKVIAKIDRVEVLYNQLKEFTADKDLEDEIEIEKLDWDVVINLLSAILFEKGGYSLSPRAREIVDYLAEFIKAHPAKMTIEGHTDDLPIHSPSMPSNWELSVARANSFLRYLADRHDISPDTISAVGYGEYHPLVPNDSEENRMRNRRLVIKMTPL